MASPGQTNPHLWVTPTHPGLCFLHFLIPTGSENTWTPCLDILASPKREGEQG